MNTLQFDGEGVESGSVNFNLVIPGRAKRDACSTTGRHTPRKRGIQYAAASRSITYALEYWIIRFRG
jgi:hypothetical protein